METITVRDLTFSYEGVVNNKKVLNGVSFDIPVGSITLLIGSSGSGKTTLLNHLKKDFCPNGKRQGTILFEGKEINDLSARENASQIGFVRQNVEAACVTDKVWHELAFGLEGLGCSQPVMQRKVAEMTAFFGLESIYNMSMDALSGGQKQMVALASVMMMEPKLLVLDEPTSQLDPISANAFFEMVRKIHRELGTTILMTEHRLEEAFSLCNQLLVMDEGRIIMSGEPKTVALELFQKNHSMHKALPSGTHLFYELEKKPDQNKMPLQVGEASAWFRSFFQDYTDQKRLGECEKGNSSYGEKKYQYINKVESVSSKDVVLHAEELWFRYERNSADILKGCSLSLKKGQITALLGGNGTGKSTFLNVLAGCYKAYDGKYDRPKQSVGRMPQNPQVMFTKKTVKEELDNLTSEEARLLAEQFGLLSLLEQHPFDLSGGEMQKLALVKLLLTGVDILLLDEPGKGMDYAAKEEMGIFLKDMAKQGKTILFVSHDVEFTAKFADVCGLFFDGHIVSLETARTFFTQNVFYTTAVRRIVKTQLPEAVVKEDVFDFFRGTALQITNDNNQKVNNSFSKKERTDDNKKHIEEKADQEEKIVVSKKIHLKHQLCIFIVLLCVMPATIYIGETFLQHRKYYFVSLLLVLESLVMVWLHFEKRKPKVREIMIVANLCALTAVGRMAFYMLPSVKPMAALVIISGVCLGSEIGFMVGSFSMLLSNIFFGQGPWTPWQMFAMGILGFLAGIVFRQNAPFTLKRKIGMCLYGLIAVVILYGGIMNPASVLMYQQHVTVDMIVAACIAGLPFDLAHGISTVIFLAIGAGIITEKLERVKKKYKM